MLFKSTQETKAVEGLGLGSTGYHVWFGSSANFQNPDCPEIGRFPSWTKNPPNNFFFKVFVSNRFSRFFVYFQIHPNLEILTPNLCPGTLSYKN